MKYLKSYNESIRHLLKPKSEDDILKLSDELSPKEKLKKGCKYGVLLLVKQALEDGVNPSIDNNNAIINAAQYGHIDIVKELLKDERVNPDVLNNFAIQQASEFGHIEVVKELLKDDRVDPSTNFNYAVQLASLNGHVEIVKELLKDKRVNPASNNNYAIRYSSQNGHIDVVKELLKDKRVDPTTNNNHAIKWASVGGHIDVVKELLKDERVREKLSKNDLDKYKIKLTESIRHLLKPKSEDEIDKKLKDLSPQEKLETGCEYGIIELIRQSLEEGDDPNVNNGHLLKKVVYYDDIESVKELLKDKRTKIFIDDIKLSIIYSNLEIIKILLKDKRTNPSKINKDFINKSYLYGKYDVLEYLLNNQLIRNNLTKKDIKFYEHKLKYHKNKLTNESIRHLLKPKSEEQINKSIENFHKKSELDKVNYFLEYNLIDMLDRDKCKELINSINPEGRLEVIFELELDDDLFTIEEIKNIVKMGNYLDQISWIYTFDLDYLFDKKYIIDLIYKNTNDTDQVLDTILLRFKDELDPYFSTHDIKKIISKEDNQEQIRLINKYELEDIYDQQELREIILDMKDGYDKLDWMLYFDEYFHEELGGLFSIDEMTKVFNKLSEKEKEEIQYKYVINF